MHRDPTAVAIWLQGEREYRNSRFAEALEFYQRTVEEDSLLAFAALKGAQAASWGDRLEAASSLLNVAISHDTLLPFRYRLLASGLQHFMIGNADSAVTDLQLAIAEEPEWSEAHMALGEVYYHLFPAGAIVDSSAQEAFATARRFDPDFTPPLFHLSEMAIRRGDTGADTLVERFIQTNPDLSLARKLNVMQECVRRGPDEDLWRRAVALDPSAAVQAARALSSAGAQLECAEAGFRALREASDVPANLLWGGLLGLQGLLVAQGREDEAIALVDSARSEGIQASLSLYLHDAVSGACGPPMEARAAEVVDFVRGAIGTNYTSISNPQTIWLLGLWHAGSGSIEELELLVEALRSKASDGDDRARVFSEALSAHLTLARGDTTGAIVLFTELRPRAPRLSITWELGDPLPAERMQLAELLFVDGRNEEALQLASTFDHPQPVSFLPYLARSLSLRYGIAQRLGRLTLAEEYRERLRALNREELLDDQLHDEPVRGG
jgi:tetratricopeptide (TPR) repeat protein